MVIFLEQYRNGATNSTISANQSETFGNEIADYQAKRRYGSFNVLTVLQNGTGAYSVILDGLETRKYKIPSTGALSINAEEGIFFDYFLIKDESGTGITAGDVSVAYAKAVQQQ